MYLFATRCHTRSWDDILEREDRWQPRIKFDCMKKIGFPSFGHWAPSPQSRTQSATDALLQSIDLAVEAERLGMDGAYFRVHHFAQQLASPFPLLAAIGAKTRKIEIGTAVIDMRYEISWQRTTPTKTVNPQSS